MSSGGPPRHIWLCADDYGMAPGVNRAIRDLIDRRRINATSVMVVGSAIDRDEVAALKVSLEKNTQCVVGLHATLTAPFHPLTMHFKPLDGGQFLPLGRLMAKSLSRRLDPEIVKAELFAQLATFRELFGRAPDYVDGHQHAQLFPQIRDAFLAAVKDAAPGAWVRQCGRASPLSQRLDNPKALLLDLLSAEFRRRSSRMDIPFNVAFAGAYDFSAAANFPTLMAGFLDSLPEGGLAMCHPGFVDDTLTSLDPLTSPREREYAYLASDSFSRMLDEKNISLALA